MPICKYIYLYTLQFTSMNQLTSKHLSVNSTQSKFVQVISERPGSRLKRNNINYLNNMLFNIQYLVFILFTWGMNKRLISGVMILIADAYLSSIIFTVS